MEAEIELTLPEALRLRPRLLREDEPGAAQSLYASRPRLLERCLQVLNDNYQRQRMAAVYLRLLRPRHDAVQLQGAGVAPAALAGADAINAAVTSNGGAVRRLLQAGAT